MQGYTGIKTLSGMGKIWCFRTFSLQPMEGISWNLAYWCILTTFRTGYILVTVFWFSSFWRNFDLLVVKQVKFGVCIHSQGDAGKECLGIWYDDVSFKLLQGCDHGVFILLALAQVWLSKAGQNLGFHAFSGERMWSEIWHPGHPMNWLDFGHCLLDFPNFCRVRSVVPCFSNWPLAAKRCRSYYR